MRWKVIKSVPSAVQQQRSKFKPILKSYCPSVQSLRLCPRLYLLQTSFSWDLDSQDFGTLELRDSHRETRG